MLLGNALFGGRNTACAGQERFVEVMGTDDRRNLGEILHAEAAGAEFRSF